MNEYAQLIKDYWKSITASATLISITFKTAYDFFSGENENLTTDAAIILGAAGATYGAITGDRAKIREREELEIALQEKETMEKWYRKYKPLANFNEAFDLIYEQSGGYTESDRIRGVITEIEKLERDKRLAVRDAKNAIKDVLGEKAILDISEMTKEYLQDPKNKDYIEDVIAQTLVANDIKKYAEMFIKGELTKGQLKGILRSLL